MIKFRHADQTIQLRVGETWSARPADNTYRDTPAGELQAIVREVEKGAPWREVVRRYYAEENPWLYRIVTSPKRDLFFRQYPPSPGARVIDIGAGWGQASLPLAQLNEVTALEPTPERLAFIRAAAVQLEVASKMHFVEADFFDVEFESRFDVACCVGVLEWVPKFRQGDPRSLQVEFLKRIHSLLKPGGQLVLGIENRVGLKYLLGVADDHICTPGVAIYDMELAARKWRKSSGQELRSFIHTKLELEELLKLAGFHYTAFYAAMPDYKLPEIILPFGSAVEEHFAHKPHILEHDGTNGRPLGEEQQDELRSHYRSLARIGIAGNFAPSFFVVAQSDQTVPPSPEKLLNVLCKAGEIESVDDIVLDFYPANIMRKDCGEKWACKVARGREVLFHLTVAHRGLNRVYERAKAFAQACPDLACKPLFFFEAEESSLQFFGQDHFDGEPLDGAVARGACDAEQWMTAVNTAMLILDKSTCSSSKEAFDEEVSQLKDGVLSIESLGILDKLLIREWIFPTLCEASWKTPIHARWTNGDFIGRNLLRNALGDIRLIDCEFARITHFFQTDSIRVHAYSIRPQALDLSRSVDPGKNSPIEQLHFWLDQLRMANTVYRPRFFLSDVPTIVERVLALTSQLSRDRSQIRTAWSSAENQARSTAAERDALRSERDALRSERDALRAECDALGAERHALRHKHDAMRRGTIESGERIAKLEQDVEHLKISGFEAKRECHSMRTSFSWKLTRPLRVLHDIVSAIRDKAKHRLLE